MDKELEALEMLSNEIRYKKEFIGNDTYRLYIKKNEIELLEKYLTELKEIKEAEPSKAMNELNEIIEYITEDKKVKYKATILFDCEIIKDALLKAQELEKENSVLKACIKDWEDDYEHLKYAWENRGKVLKIIFEKNVDVEALKLSTSWLEYYTIVRNKTFKNTELTEEEFDLLKRWSEK